MFFFFQLKYYVSNLNITCGHKEQCSNSKGQWKTRRQEQSEHGPRKKIEVGSGTMEE